MSMSMGSRVLTGLNTIVPEKCNSLNTTMYIVHGLSLIIGIALVFLCYLIYKCSTQLNCIPSTACVDYRVGESKTITINSVPIESNDICAEKSMTDTDSCKKHLKTYQYLAMGLGVVLVMINGYGLFAQYSKKNCIVKD